MKLYVGNLSSSVEENELAKLFGDFKSLMSTKVIKDKNSGLSRGFAFVEFEDNKDGQEAIEKFNNYEFHNMTLKVSEAIVKRKRPKRPSGVF